MSAQDIMPTPITVNVPHQLGRAEARRRIDSGIEKLVQQLPGSQRSVSQRWDGDRLTFRLETLGQSCKGVIDVLDAAVTIEIELSGALGLIASRFKSGLQKTAGLLLKK